MSATVAKTLYIVPAPKPAPPGYGSDGELIAGCVRGDPAAMRAFYDLHRRRVFGLILRIAGPDEAEELAQEVFLRAFRSLPSFRGEAQSSTWMYRLAVNAALSHATRRRASAWRRADESELDAVAGPAVPEADPRLRARLERALGRLPPGYRAALVLHDIEGLEHEEIAEVLGVSVGTSKSQLHKARGKMRALLREGGWEGGA